MTHIVPATRCPFFECHVAALKGNIICATLLQFSVHTKRTLQHIINHLEYAWNAQNILPNSHRSVMAVKNVGRKTKEVVRISITAICWISVVVILSTLNAFFLIPIKITALPISPASVPSRKKMEKSERSKSLLMLICMFASIMNL